MADVSANATPSNIPAVARKVVDNGTGDFKLLQDDARVEFQSISGSPSQAEVEALRDALVAAGIMKSS